MEMMSRGTMQWQEPAAPKLVRIVARLLVSGVSRQVCMLHQELAPALDPYLVIGSLAEDEQDMSYLLSSRQNVFSLPRLSRRISPLDDLLAFWSIYRILRKVRPAIVHTHTAKAGAVGRLAAWLARVPIIVHTYHGHVFYGYFGPLTTRLFLVVERLLGKLSTCIVAISESQRRDLVSRFRVAPREKVVVIHNGFELERFSPEHRDRTRAHFGIAPDEFVILWAGRLAPVKDVELLGRVVQRAQQEHRNFRFLVAGDGSERARLEQSVQGCHNLKLLGWCKNMEELWSAADAALLTSRNEGTPTALIEGLAAGVPFVATHVGGVADIAAGTLQPLSADVGFMAANGFLTQRSPEALLHCLELLSSNPAMYSEMSAAGMAFVRERFSMQRLLAEIASLYQSLLQSRGLAPSPVRATAHPSTSSGLATDDYDL